MQAALADGLSTEEALEERANALVAASVEQLLQVCTTGRGLPGWWVLQGYEPGHNSPVASTDKSLRTQPSTETMPATSD